MSAGLLLGGLAALAPFVLRPARSRRAGASVATVATGAPSRGWELEAGEQLTPATEAALDRLAAAAPGVRIFVTDGIRSAEDQASAMWSKYERGEDVLGLYADDEQVSAILDAGPDIAAMASVIRSYAARGRRISRHLAPADPTTKGAADIRTRDLSAADVGALKAAADRLGIEAYTEFDHLHLEV